jgi:hypothetical protein
MFQSISARLGPFVDVGEADTHWECWRCSYKVVEPSQSCRSVRILSCDVPSNFLLTANAKLIFHETFLGKPRFLR